MATALDGGALFGPLHDNITCQVKIVGIEEGAVRVANVSARERISDLFGYELEVGTDPDGVASLEKALGAEATVLLTRDGQRERVAHGILTMVLPDGGFVGKGQARTRILVEPRLANLRYSGGHRIFQQMTVKDIVGELVAPEQIEIDWRVLDELPKRDYRTQLDESDLDFLMRLVADEGLHFFFDHDDEKTTLVFTNEPLGFRELDGGATFDFRDSAGVVAAEHVRSIARAQRVRTGALEHRDYDFRNPRLKLVAREETPDPQTEANTKRRERREYPGAFDDPDVEGNRRARMRLQELRSDAYTVEGTASSLRFLAGRAFTLAGHPDRAFNRKFIVTEVSFSGSVDGAFNGAPNPGGHGRTSPSLASFVAVPADVPIRPNRKAKPPARLQTARVVGPKDGDPFVDEFGRVKVQFPWDRDGKEDEHSSCWMRMATPVAYDQGGFFSPHRVGCEVLVDFVDGDIDRPLVTAAVYNGQQRQFHKQPDDAAKSAWIERSVPGGEGYNGITFDNTAGKEKIDTHAELDRKTHVGRNHSETIGANQMSTIGANRTATIAANDTTTIGANRSETVVEKEDVTVKKGRTHTVEEGNDVLYLPHGDREIDVYEGNHTLNAKLLVSTHSDNHEIEARYDLHARADRKIEIAQKGASCTMEDEHIIVQAPQHIVIDCPSGAAFFKDKKLTLQAVDELVLQCGQSALSLKKDGTVTIQGAKLISAAVSNSSIKLEPAKAAIAGASVEVNAVGQAKIAGAIVKIN
jgi:type VI secretion system secreted protein VgrG